MVRWELKLGGVLSYRRGGVRAFPVIYRLVQRRSTCRNNHHSMMMALLCLGNLLCARLALLKNSSSCVGRATGSPVHWPLAVHST